MDRPRPHRSTRPQFPVAVLKPGMGFAAPQYTTIAENLASHGYLVAGVTPTYSANLSILNGLSVPATKAGNPAAFDAPDLHAGEAQAVGDQLAGTWADDDRFAAAQIAALDVCFVDRPCVRTCSVRPSASPGLCRRPRNVWGGVQGVLIGDETGFLKKDLRSAGVQWQYSGTAGRVENCQIGTSLAYASQHGHALIDRELYLPESWTGNRDRCRAAGIPDEVEFATKPQQLMAMLARAIDAGVPFAWVTADEAYGQAPYLRTWLEEQDAWYVLATRCTDTIATSSGEVAQADELVAVLPGRSWRRLSVGAGAHGPREYDWARIPIRTAWRPAGDTGCWRGARSATRPKSPTTTATGPVAPPCWTWPGSPDPAGESRNASSKPKTRPGSTTTRSAAGGPGMPTSPCPCSPTPGWPRPKHWP